MHKSHGNPFTNWPIKKLSNFPSCMITHYGCVRITKWPLWSLTRRDRAQCKMCVGYIYIIRSGEARRFISLRYTLCESCARYTTDSENTHCRHLLGAFWQKCRFRSAQYFLTAPIAWRPSGKGTQAGSVMRMGFFWLAALVFACAGECRGNFAGVFFCIYLTGWQSINFLRKMRQNTKGSLKIFLDAKNVSWPMRKSLTWEHCELPCVWL